ncbi:MAG: hypothetical protein WCB67_19195, partial [Solirubrobacteraceae bacterium]
MVRRPLRALLLALLAAGFALSLAPVVASAHGPVAPIATSYLAKVSQLPAGLTATVVDGDQRLWLAVAADETVVVLDPRGAPYLRFTSSGVAVNENSETFYANLTPAQPPPADLTASTPPRWAAAGGGHAYSWHDGRLHALATVALSPGRSYVGRWSIPVRVNGRPRVIAGGLYYAGAPSLVWFWPIVVVIACTLAAVRLRREQLDARLARLLAGAALAAAIVAAVGRELHGRPGVSIFQTVTFAVIAAFVLWACRQLLLRRESYFTFFAVGCVAIWEGVNLLPTLWNGFVLAAVPAFAARAACVICVGCGVGVLVVSSRQIVRSDGEAGWDEDDDEDILGSGA